MVLLKNKWEDKAFSFFVTESKNWAVHPIGPGLKFNRLGLPHRHNRTIETHRGQTMSLYIPILHGAIETRAYWVRHYLSRHLRHCFIFAPD